MKKDGPEADRGPVLGLFQEESGLRDHIAANLDLIEAELELLKTEYSLHNSNGAGGRIDILARDRFDHLLCIEVKRSDRSARDTLNELAKYIVLLIDQERVPREMIRCIVVSTHWHELLVPLSYFAASSGVDVVALHAVAEEGVVQLVPWELRPLGFLPQFCPEMEIVWFDDADLRDRYVENLSERAVRLAFVRMALLLLEPEGQLAPGRSPYAVVICVWRVADADHESIEAVTGKAIGNDWPYLFEGWEAESDAMGWIAEIPDELRGLSGWSYGTPERLGNMLENYRVDRVNRIGNWPKLDFINDDDRIINSALARSPLSGSAGSNRHFFDAQVTPAVAPSWKRAVKGFLEFIGFEPAWHAEAEPFLNALPSYVEVQLHAFDKKHLFYAMHQANEHPDATLGSFEIIVSAEGSFLAVMVGRYEWDGRTCPTNAQTAIETVYGDLLWASLGVWNAVDSRRYETALPLHGFLPVVDVLLSVEDLEAYTSTQRPGLREFVEAHPDYTRQVSALLERHGSLPTNPAG